MGEKKPFSLEENFAALEEVISRMEEEDIPLEEAFSAYSEGMKLLKDCNAQIDKVEKKVLKLNAEGKTQEL
jgi:exonuclease VII small subunit